MLTIIILIIKVQIKALKVQLLYNYCILLLFMIASADAIRYDLYHILLFLDTIIIHTLGGKFGGFCENVVFEKFLYFEFNCKARTEQSATRCNTASKSHGCVNAHYLRLSRCWHWV